MSKLVNVKADSTLNISVEEHLFENIRKAHTWYTNKAINLPAILILAAIDVFGFLQIINLTVAEDSISRIIITSALAVAFEIAPLYIGYSICLKCYKLGRCIHNWVLIFSCSACFLGIIANIYFRFKTIDVAYLDPTTGEVNGTGLPLTVLMSILPIITSLINLVIGCLTFDPLEFDLLRLSKKLAKLKLRTQQIKAYLEEFSDEETLQKKLELEEKECYEKVKRDIYALQGTLKIYTVVRTSNLHRNKKNK